MNNNTTYDDDITDGELEALALFFKTNPDQIRECLNNDTDASHGGRFECFGQYEN